MDVRMPVMDGVEATRVIKKQSPGINVIVLTTFDDDEYVRAAISHGAGGYLLKDIPPEKLVASILAAQDSSFMLSPSVAQNLAGREPDTHKAFDQVPEVSEKLTRRERRVLDLLLQGMDNATMAEKLFLSERTIRNYVSILYAKLGVHNRLQLFQVLKHGE